MIHDLMTTRGEELLRSGNTPWQTYPRPTMRRNSYVNLNGRWAYTVSDKETFPDAYDREILVPFCPESQLSGVCEHPEDGKYLFYRRSFKLPEGFLQDRVLLHFGAVDQFAEIYVNQKRVYSHAGGYFAFCVDITDVLQEENELVVRARDDLRTHVMPYGKQVLKRGGMWYTPVSGIWQTVWLESVPAAYITRLTTRNQGDSITISIEPKLEGKVIVPALGEFPLENGSVTITPDAPHRWSPEDPYLYDFSVETAQDRVESYFAIRSLEIRKAGKYQRLCLNGKPYFFHGLLDQGYWPDGLFTPAAPECYAEDILAMKALGFNMLRKHIKVEAEEFYYQCDKLGMVVFQDMINNGAYSFFRDTALPTVGIQRLPDRLLHTDAATRAEFIREMELTVRQLEKHPSICYWTVFNEGWGQFDSDRVCAQMRKLDDTRFIDATSGWFRRSNTDVDSRHVYFRKVQLEGKDKPLVLSEFGGYSYKAPGHVFNTEQTYGYGKFEALPDFAAALTELYDKQIVPAVEKGLCAAVYTQVSDVEDETNGLLSYDRKVCKADAAAMTAIATALRSTLDDACGS